MRVENTFQINIDAPGMAPGGGRVQAPSRSDLNSSWKEAKLETGLQIMVPLFIANGDIIRVDTAGRKYLGKDTSGE